MLQSDQTTKRIFDFDRKAVAFWMLSATAGSHFCHVRSDPIKGQFGDRSSGIRRILIASGPLSRPLRPPNTSAANSPISSTKDKTPL
ncbi:hypothetical protein [Bradyrhizobium sp. LTSP849]|uniref:hypothetical protein n=1 Tax=Bradyrhizobium sp. LTSP849 TaxID=1615890 RepID=UPI000AAFD64F|nr:hypothetical protein [Bradyrhizobium sp. LTSP849]